MREPEHLPSCAAQWLQMRFPADSWHTYPCRSIFNPHHLLPCFSNFLPVSTLQICHPLLIYLMNLPLHYAIAGTITCCNTYITVYWVHASWFIWLLSLYEWTSGTRIIPSLDCPPYYLRILSYSSPLGRIITLHSKYSRFRGRLGYSFLIIFQLHRLFDSQITLVFLLPPFLLTWLPDLSLNWPLYLCLLPTEFYF